MLRQREASRVLRLEDNLGGALILEGKEEAAFPHFEAAARINPRDPMSHSNLGAYFQTHGHMAEAITQYEQAIGLTSDATLLAQTYANLGAAERTLGEDVAAHDDFLRAVRLNPNQFNAWLGLGLLAQKQGNVQEALADFTRSLEIQPTAEAYFDLGEALAQSGRIPEAIAAYQQALKLNPDLSQAHQALDALPVPK
jgi:superkiller protein 3